jgi:two-component system, chemotaxis family, chemotaxis protein CheY
MSVKVLVVDDTDHVRNMLVEMLELDGFSVVGKADSGRMAIDLASASDPDVVVMDYKMPDMDGLAAARTIKDERPGQAIILYTAYMDPALEAKAKQSGIALCVGKVEGLNQLEHHISELCRNLA